MLKTFEKLWAMVMLIFGSGAFGLLLVGPMSDRQRIAPEGNNFALAVNVGFHLVASLFYILHARKLTVAITRAPWLFALVFYAGLSTTWSQDPSLTFRRSLILLATTVFGVYFGSRFELKEQLQILAWALLFALVASAGLAIVAPSLGVESGGHLGDWRGLFSQKNVLARIAVLAILAFVFWRPRYRPFRYFAIAFGIGVLGMARSGTGFLVMIALVAVIPLFRLIRTKPVLLVPIAMVLLVVGAVLGVVLVGNADLALAFLGRNATLTGRTELWHACLVSIMKRPLQGYGFDAFWLGMTGESALVDGSVHWLVPTAHNGALDLLLSLGAVGLGLFLFAYSVCLRKSFQFYVRHQSHLRAWPLAYLVFFLLYNITEVTEMEQNSIFMMLFAALAATVTMRAFQSQANEYQYAETNEEQYLPSCDLEPESIYLSQ
jgi:exopolysaccharide production protein ExoQ